MRRHFLDPLKLREDRVAESIRQGLTQAVIETSAMLEKFGRLRPCHPKVSDTPPTCNLYPIAALRVPRLFRCLCFTVMSGFTRVAEGVICYQRDFEK
jgi:hypothetical protein